MLMAELSFFICFPLSIGMEVWESRGGRRNLWKLNPTNSMHCMCVRVGVCEYVCVCKKQISWPALRRVCNCNHPLSFKAEQRAALHTHWPQMDRASCHDPMTATVSPLLPPTVPACLTTPGPATVGSLTPTQTTNVPLPLTSGLPFRQNTPVTFPWPLLA